MGSDLKETLDKTKELQRKEEEKTLKGKTREGKEHKEDKRTITRGRIKV